MSARGVLRGKGSQLILVFLRKTHHRYLKGSALLGAAVQHLGVDPALQPALKAKGVAHVQHGAPVGHAAPSDAGQVIRPAIGPVDRQSQVADGAAQWGGAKVGGAAQAAGQRQLILVLLQLCRQNGAGIDRDDQPPAYPAAVVVCTDLPGDLKALACLKGGQRLQKPLRGDDVQLIRRPG